MPRYMVLFKANPSAFPTDPKQVLAIAEMVTAGVDQLLKTGVVKDTGWFSPTDGYGILEADSKAKIIGITAAFFPFFSQEIHEIVSWEETKQAFLSSVRAAVASVQK